MNGLHREIVLLPAYDRRTKDAYGKTKIHGVDLQFNLRGVDGAIQFVVFTHWQLPDVQKEIDKLSPDSRYPHLLHEPLPCGVSYHSWTAMYEGQTPEANCGLIVGGRCFCGIMGLRSNRGMMDILRTGGSEAVWKELESCYRERFSTVAEDCQ